MLNSVLREILRDPLHFLLIADWTFVFVLWVLGLRLAFIRAEERAQQLRFLPLRRPLPANVSNDYLTHHRQLMRLMYAFVAVLATGVLLVFQAAN